MRTRRNSGERPETPASEVNPATLDLAHRLSSRVRDSDTTETLPELGKSRADVPDDYLQKRGDGLAVPTAVSGAHPPDGGNPTCPEERRHNSFSDGP
jgi:hypothetical protein